MVCENVREHAKAKQAYSIQKRPLNILKKAVQRFYENKKWQTELNLSETTFQEKQVLASHSSES